MEQEKARKRKEKQEEREYQKKLQNADIAFQKEWSKTREVF